MNIFISETKLKTNTSYKSGICGGTIVHETNKIQLDNAIKFKQRQNAHYKTKGSLYFNYLNEDMLCTKVFKVV